MADANITEIVASLVEGQRSVPPADVLSLLRQCGFGDVADEVEQLRADRRRYVGDLGISWCVRHCGVVNEDSGRCDMFDSRDPDEPLDEDGEPLPCDTRDLAYIATDGAVDRG